MQFMEGFLEELVSELTLKAREPLSGKEMWGKVILGQCKNINRDSETWKECDVGGITIGKGKGMLQNAGVLSGQR
jgi:hypothetical protein